MALPLNKIAVIGAGVIGSGWIIRLLAKNKIVYLYEPKASQHKFLLKEIRRTRKSTKQ